MKAVWYLLLWTLCSSIVVSFGEDPNIIVERDDKDYKHETEQTHKVELSLIK